MVSNGRTIASLWLSRQETGSAHTRSSGPQVAAGSQRFITPATLGRNGCRDQTASSEVAGDTAERQRLAREARTETSLRHPNILACYATGEWNGRPYLVTEYIGGESLRHQLGKPLPVLLTIDIALACLEGLGAAHHAGVIHRDLKPDNIMIDRSGSVKLLDFGLARECDRQATLNIDPARDCSRQCSLHLARAGARFAGRCSHGFVEPGRHPAPDANRRRSIPRRNNRRDPDRNC